MTEIFVSVTVSTSWRALTTVRSSSGRGRPATSFGFWEETIRSWTVSSPTRRIAFWRLAALTPLCGYGVPGLKWELFALSIGSTHLYGVCTQRMSPSLGHISSQLNSKLSWLGTFPVAVAFFLWLTISKWLRFIELIWCCWRMVSGWNEGWARSGQFRWCCLCQSEENERRSARGDQTLVLEGGNNESRLCQSSSSSCGFSKVILLFGCEFPLLGGGGVGGQETEIGCYNCCIHLERSPLRQWAPK